MRYNKQHHVFYQLYYRNYFLSSFPSNKSDYQKPENISTADDAKKALEAGNKAYKDGNIDITATNADRTDLSENGQKPYAVVITCSDSRVPPELILTAVLENYSPFVLQAM